MSSHPEREDLLGFHLGLLDAEERSSIEAHLESCSTCREALDDVGEMMDVVDDTISVDEPKTIEPLSLVQRLSRSAMTPALVMAISILLSAIADVTWVSAAVIPLLAGAGVVVWWLYGVVSRVERSWSGVGEVDWRSAIISGDEDQLRFFAGVKLSVLQSLSKARSQVAQLLTISGVVFIVSGAATLLAGLWAPEATAQATAGRSMIVPGGLAAGIMLGAVVWASFRLARLSRAVADFLKALTDESTSS